MCTCMNVGGLMCVVITSDDNRTIEQEVLEKFGIFLPVTLTL